MRILKISLVLAVLASASCTKLNETYTSSFPKTTVVAALGPQFPGLLLNTVYTDLPGVFVGQDQLFSLEENSTDESLVPTRGGDWDDNGVWRVIHNHQWNADHSQILSVYNNLNRINFDATNVLQFGPSAAQIAEARVLRAMSLYYLLDLYGQYPFRNPGEDLLKAPKVYSGDSAVLFIINEITASLPDIAATNGNTRISQAAANFLLMKLYLNRGAFNNRAAPTFDDADMQKVITLGNAIISSGKYSYMSNFFDNFSNTNSASTEAIFIFPSSSGLTVNNPGMQARWMMGNHYNIYTPQAPNAGWNGFTTMSDFYKTFAVTGTMNYSYTDTQYDSRLGRRVNTNRQAYDASGFRAGLQVGQQYDENGVALKDRKGNPLSYDPNISPTMIESGSNLEVTGIRAPKYVPDFSDPSGKYYSSNPGNSLMLMRYPNVVLMVAEAKMRSAAADNAGALALVNALRLVRGAPAMAAPLVLANPTNADDPNTLIAERGREFYFVSNKASDCHIDSG